jgi:hypothetical protein
MDKTRQLARLMEVLHQGEQLAADTAAQQSAMAPVPWMRHALQVQAAQERNHAALARTAARLTGTSQILTGTPDVYAALRQRLDHDLATGDLACSLLGLQGVIEHMGEVLLEQLGHQAHPAGAVLHALRRKVLAQEHGHVQLGARCLQTLGHRTATIHALDCYRTLGRHAVMQVTELLDDAQLDAGTYWRRIESRLDDWQRRACLPYAPVAPALP